jgi:hypothetical protein
MTTVSRKSYTILLGLRVRKLSTQMNVTLVVGQQFLDSMRMGSPGKPPQSFSRSRILKGLKREETRNNYHTGAYLS